MLLDTLEKLAAGKLAITSSDGAAQPKNCVGTTILMKAVAADGSVPRKKAPDAKPKATDADGKLVKKALAMPPA